MLWGPDIFDSWVVKFQERNILKEVDPWKANDGTRWNSERARSKEFFPKQFRDVNHMTMGRFVTIPEPIAVLWQFNAIQVDARQE